MLRTGRAVASPPVAAQPHTRLSCGVKSVQADCNWSLRAAGRQWLWPRWSTAYATAQTTTTPTISRMAFLADSLQ
eukprot:5271567-Prymnesium_polylepis.1